MGFTRFGDTGRQTCKGWAMTDSKFLTCTHGENWGLLPLPLGVNIYYLNFQFKLKIGSTQASNSLLPENLKKKLFFRVWDLLAVTPCIRESRQTGGLVAPMGWQGCRSPRGSLPLLVYPLTVPVNQTLRWDTKIIPNQDGLIDGGSFHHAKFFPSAC